MSASRARGNQARTTGNVPAPRTKKTHDDPTLHRSYMGRTVSVPKRNERSLTGVIRSYMVGVKKLAVTFMEELNGRSIPFHKSFYEHDVIPSDLDPIGRKLAVDRLQPQRSITVKHGGSDITPVMSKKSVV
eukprot:1179969-Prorocentrum_minimum.AAC.4